MCWIRVLQLASWYFLVCNYFAFSRTSYKWERVVGSLLCRLPVLQFISSSSVYVVMIFFLLSLVRVMLPVVEAPRFLYLCTARQTWRAKRLLVHVDVWSLPLHLRHIPRREPPKPEPAVFPLYSKLFHVSSHLHVFPLSWFKMLSSMCDSFPVIYHHAPASFPLFVTHSSLTPISQ